MVLDDAQRKLNQNDALKRTTWALKKLRSVVAKSFGIEKDELTAYNSG